MSRPGLLAAREGRGVTQVLSYQVVDDLASGRLVRLLQPWEPPPLPVQLLTKGRTHRAPKIDAFIDFAAVRAQGVAGPGRGDGRPRPARKVAIASIWMTMATTNTPVASAEDRLRNAPKAAGAKA